MSAVSDRNRRPEYYQWFRQDIDHVAQDGGQSTISLTTYLNREWFSHWWRLYCVDYGTQAHLTRDGALSTNNLAEASFKTFDRVFLSCRVNKRSVSLEVTSETYLMCFRLDRLLIIILTVFFPSTRVTQMKLPAQIPISSTESSMELRLGNRYHRIDSLQP